ncbi:hypothetical protein [Flavobacterium sp. M31R6]|uniref:hypothetical protein n=1 Tax=Flavobacterium sp. M31R6 TaxID=2739062 RepID=UPI00156986E8|nr:hypothetical protein [Flavobacterium sp. M31R6]QKJ63231.1 hypothetical protein HQN62_08820 [Flavobacterium sp. M31R6]
MKTILLKQKFEELACEIINEAETFSFNLSDLPEIADYKISIRNDNVFGEILSNLDKKINNCIYWFETENNDSCNNLQKLLDGQRENLSLNARTVPVKNRNKDSNVLYVGIRRGGLTKKYNMSHLSGRIKVHLGYYNVGSTQGLQFAHWARNIDCKINLKVVQFEELPNEYLNTVEKILAFKLKPLIGKH